MGQGDLKTNPLQMAVAYAAIANGGNVVRPHVGLEVTDQGGRVVQEIQPAPQRHLDINPDYSRAILEGLHMAAQQDGGTSFSVFGNFPIPVAGKTGTAERPLQEDQSWYVVLAPYPDPQIVVAVTIEQRRVRRPGGGTGRMHHPPGLLRQGGRVEERRHLRRPQLGPDHVDGNGLLMVTEAMPRPFDDRAKSEPRIGLLRLDLPLALGALALIGFSLYTLGVTTDADVPHDPYYYVTRQAIYGVIGIALMLALARVEYSRFRELRVGLYTVMVASIVLVLVLGQATRGSKRWIELPFFTFQPSELGKVLLVAALAGFVIERGRRTSERQRTARLLLLGLVPAALVFMQPDLGTGAVYAVITLAVLFVAGVRWTHFAALGALVVGAVALVLVIAPAIGHPVLKGYQEERLTSFLHPSADPAELSYQ